MIDVFYNEEIKLLLVIEFIILLLLIYILCFLFLKRLKNMKLVKKFLVSREGKV